MKQSCLLVAVGTFILSFGPHAVAAADKPRLPVDRGESKPVDGDANPAGGEARPVEGKVKLGGVIEFAPPQGWISAPKASTPVRAAFVSPDKQAMISIEVLPASMKIDPDLAAEMVRKMKQNRQANGQKFVAPPAVEKDENFVIRIRERYEIKDKIADQLHLYRAVGPRFLLVTVNSLGGEEKAKEDHAAAVAASLSGVYTPAKK